MNLPIKPIMILESFLSLSDCVRVWSGPERRRNRIVTQQEMMSAVTEPRAIASGCRRQLALRWFRVIGSLHSEWWHPLAIALRWAGTVDALGYENILHAPDDRYLGMGHYTRPAVTLGGFNPVSVSSWARCAIRGWRACSECMNHCRPGFLSRTASARSRLR